MDTPSTPEELLRDEQLRVVAAERDRIAGELHDDSVQAMTAVSLILQRLQGRVIEPDDRVLLGRARETTDTAIERLRHMLFVLHPTSLEEDGLVVTIDIYLETFVGPYDVLWSVVGDESVTMPVGVAALGFRLAREAIGNALKHATPSRIDVTVAIDQTNLVILIADDGRGFNPNGTRAAVGHLGIAHSRALAEAALGSLEITSSEGSGTTVTVTLPLGSDDDS